VALASTSQDDFSGGIYRGRKAPATSVYDAVNALIDDTGLLFRRGGSKYRSTSNADGALLGLWDGQTTAGRRTVSWSATSAYVLAADEATVLNLGSTPPAANAAGVEIGGLVFFRGGVVSNYETEVVYAGSRKAAQYSAGSMTVTAGSVTVTGTGTAWLANVDAGMIMLFADTAVRSFVGVVKSVETNTSLTLAAAPNIGSGGPIAYIAAPIWRFNITDLSGNQFLPKGPVTAFHAVAGQRLIRTRDNRAYFSRRASEDGFGNFFTNAYPATIVDTSSDYHELPGAASIIGADAINDTLVLFTTSGVWAISNLALDAVDAFGNIQHSVEQISQDLVLWGDAGIAGWSGAMVVPAIDDVYVFSPGAAAVPITRSIRPLYRDYVKLGYQPGTGAVFRGHYFLPVLNGTALVDVLVCRLDRPQGDFWPWTRWAGHAAGAAFQQRVGVTTRAPLILGVSGARVTDLSGCFVPAAANAQDADGTTSDYVLTTSDFPTGDNQYGFVQRARLRYELTDDGNGATAAPTVAIAYSSDQDGGTFTTLTERGEQGGAAGWGVSVGDKYQWALVGKRRERIRFRVTVTGACASFVLRSIELLLRPTGKQ
jgi:hypothetical protein